MGSLLDIPEDNIEPKGGQYRLSSRYGISWHNNSFTSGIIWSQCVTSRDGGMQQLIKLLSTSLLEDLLQY